MSPDARPAAAAARSAARSASVSSIEGTEYVACANATRPSGLTVPVVDGSLTKATLGAARRVASTSPTLAAFTGSVSEPPSGAAKTTRAEAPVASAAGNRAWSVSMAVWASVPGMEKLVDVGPLRVAAPMLTPTRIRSQRPSTARRWR